MKNKTTYQRVINGIGVNFYSQISTTVVQLAGLPIMLHAWGSQIYGEWLILTAMTAYVAMIDLGLMQTCLSEMTAKIANGDKDSAIRIFQFLYTMVTAISGALIVLICLYLYYSPAGMLPKLGSISNGNERWIILLLIINSLLTVFETVIHSALRSENDYALHSFIYTTTSLIQNIGVWSIALVKAGPIYAAILMNIVHLILLPILIYLAIARHPWIRFKFNMYAIVELKRLVKPAIANISLPLAQSVNLQGAVIIIGSTLGPVFVVVFTTIRTLTRLAIQVVMSIAQAVEPEFAYLQAKGEVVQVVKLFENTLRGALWSAIVTMISLYAFGGYIYYYWTHGKLQLDSGLFNWLLFTATVSVIWNVVISYLKSTNSHFGISIVYLAISLAGMLLLFVISSSYHRLYMSGIVLFIVDFIFSIISLKFIASMIKRKMFQILLEVINPCPLYRVIFNRKLS